MIKQEILTKMDELKKEISDGLSSQQKTLPCKLFYDEKGSKLFDKICNLEEYYPTRTELMIMKGKISEIVETIGENVLFIEFGSGSSLKTRLLLSNLKNVAGYIPIDISEEHLNMTADSLNERYPDLKIYPLAADYTEEFILPETEPGFSRKTGFFPGSTIGNFTHEEAKNFLNLIAKILGKGGGLLIGADLKKDVSILHKAYNDIKGITAQFNKNILERLNREFGFNFDLSRFRHDAVYNEKKGRIEMYLISLIEQVVKSEDHSWKFEKGERLLTEYSHKFSPEEFAELASDSFVVKKIWMDEKKLFSVFYFEVK